MVKKVLLVLLLLLTQVFFVSGNYVEAKGKLNKIRFLIICKPSLYKRLPPKPISDIMAFQDEDAVVISFENKDYKEITVSIQQDGVMVYSEHFSHSDGEDINIPIADLPIGDYVITIESPERTISGQFNISSM